MNKNTKVEVWSPSSHDICTLCDITKDWPWNRIFVRVIEGKRKIKNVIFIEKDLADSDEKNVCCQHHWDHLLKIFWKIIDNNSQLTQIIEQFFANIFFNSIISFRNNFQKLKKNLNDLKFYIIFNAKPSNWKKNDKCLYKCDICLFTFEKT